MRLTLALALSTLVATTLTACGGSGGDDADNFVGAYQTSLTLSGGGSQTYTDSVNISEGSTSDLIIQSQQIGTLKASIIGNTSFALDSQVLNLTDSNGQAFSVNVSGQGTVNDGVLGASGTFTSPNGALSFTMNGSRL